MLVNFEDQPSHARLWIYQADRFLSQTECGFINDELKPKIAQWAAHGAPLRGSAVIVADRFVVIAVDEDLNAPSGCSIDASTHWLRDLGQQMGITFFDRSVVYLQDQIFCSVDALRAKKVVESGEITAQTPIFDTLINTVGEFRLSFPKPAEETWMKRLFKTMSLN